MKYLIIILLTFILSSCCTKRSCVGEMLPTIWIAFGNNDTTNRKVYFLENGNRVDSLVIPDYTAETFLQPYPQFVEGRQNTRTIIINQGSKSDTLFDVNCDMVRNNIVCNKCFLFVEKREEVKSFINFSFRYKNEILSHNEQVIIN